MCETKFGVGRSLCASRRLARGWPPMPTPMSGCSSITRVVSSTRSVRSLVILFKDFPSASCTATYAQPASSAAAAPAAPRRAGCGASPVATASASVTTSSATMLDCE